MPVATPDREGDLTEGAGGEKREVVESDIWRLEGDRMYFFNQYRGLQIVDLSNVDQPQLMGEMELPAAGEQMYLVDAGHAVLLARNSCSYWSGDAFDAGRRRQSHRSRQSCHRRKRRLRIARSWFALARATAAVEPLGARPMDRWLLWMCRGPKAATGRAGHAECGGRGCPPTIIPTEYRTRVPTST